MALWSTALANIGQFFQFPRAPLASPGGKGRKSKLPKTYKPAPLVTPFQKYKKQERASWLSDTSSQYSSSGSSSSSSSSSIPSDTNGNPTPPGSSPPSFFEPTGTSDALVPDHVRLRMEFARMRLRGHSRGGRAVHNAFDNPAVRRRLDAQRLHDHASMQLLSTQVPHVVTSDPLALAPFVAPAPAPSFIVQKWHGLKKEAEARREDQAVYEKIYEQIRNVNPAATVRWRAYEQRWAFALGAAAGDAPPLRFQDVPWPISLTPRDGSHIHAVDVYQFVLCTTDLDNVPQYAIPRFTQEIQRWQTERFAAEVLPRVIPSERESVVAAAGAVLDILLKARRDILSLLAARGAASV
ncbi:hypothetical protein K438DRAFT_1971335 [Mycena galopus ATCC 62051]|nr:hypothetical protein K438DRAFT_1971335 [Mycena galopus ATCC 62051]